LLHLLHLAIHKPLIFFRIILREIVQELPHSFQLLRIDTLSLTSEHSSQSLSHS
jgi:hypothetical protein